MRHCFSQSGVALARVLQDFYFPGVYLLLRGYPVDLGINALIPHRGLEPEADPAKVIKAEQVQFHPKRKGVMRI